MPSSPKFTNSHQPSRVGGGSSLLIILSWLGISGFFFGLTSFFFLYPSGLACRCFNSPTQSFSVRAPGDKTVNTVKNDVSLEIGETRRHKVMGFVGIQTGFESTGRRRSLRMSWMPSNRASLDRLEESTGLAFRFVIGRTKDETRMLGLQKEIALYNDFLLLDIDEQYSRLPHKTLAYFRAAYALFDSKFYVKIDDDIYLRPDRLSLLLAKERPHPFTYVGCMKKGPFYKDPKHKWYEPLSHLLGKEYFLHAYGSIYALSADVVATLVALRNDSIRIYKNEDVMIGSLMLAMNVDHEDNRALCEEECSPSSIAVWTKHICSGLCHPESRLLHLHRNESCSKGPIIR